MATPGKKPKEGDTRTNRAGNKEVLRGGRWRLADNPQVIAKDKPAAIVPVVEAAPAAVEPEPTTIAEAVRQNKAEGKRRAGFNPDNFKPEVGQQFNIAGNDLKRSQGDWQIFAIRDGVISLGRLKDGKLTNPSAKNLFTVTTEQLNAMVATGSAVLKADEAPVEAGEMAGEVPELKPKGRGKSNKPAAIVPVVEDLREADLVDEALPDVPMADPEITLEDLQEPGDEPAGGDDEPDNAPGLVLWAYDKILKKLDEMRLSGDERNRVKARLYDRVDAALLENPKDVDGTKAAIKAIFAENSAPSAGGDDEPEITLEDLQEPEKEAMGGAGEDLRRDPDKTPWLYTASQYQTAKNVPQPWIGEISPTQLSLMGKRQKEQYIKQNMKKWDASAQIKREWADKVWAAYQNNEFDLEEIPHSSSTSWFDTSVKELIFRRKKAERKAGEDRLINEANEENKVGDASEVEIGDRIYHSIFKTYAVVEKKFKNTVRVFDGTNSYNMDVRLLRWKSYDEMKQAALNGEPIRPPKPEFSEKEPAKAKPKAKPKAKATSVSVSEFWGKSLSETTELMAKARQAANKLGIRTLTVDRLYTLEAKISQQPDPENFKIIRIKGREIDYAAIYEPTLTKSLRPYPGPYLTLLGVRYVLDGGILRKAARKSTLNTGDTKVVNGVTYTFNENRRWARADKKAKTPRAKATPKAARPPVASIPILEDTPKVKGKPRGMKPKAAPNAQVEGASKQARRGVARSVSAEGLKPKAKPTQLKPKAGASPEAKPEASQGIVLAKKDNLTAKPKGKPKGKQKAKAADVDSRYATANPTDEQAKNFLKDKTDEFLGDPKSDRKEAIKEVHDRFKKTKVKDKKTYVQAVLRNQEISIENWDRDGQSWMADNKSKIKRVESRLTDAKTDKARKRAQLDLDKLLQEKTELETGLRNIEELRKKPQEQRIAEAEQRYEQDIKQATQDRANRRAAYQKGDKKVVSEVNREVRSNLIRPMLDDPEFEDYIPARNMLTGRVEQPSVLEQAKAYLRLVHRSGGGDASALGLDTAKPSLEELRRAYRKKAVEAHPDQGGSREAFEAVRDSYERLMKKHYPDLLKSLQSGPYVTLLGVRYILDDGILRKAGMSWEDFRCEAEAMHKEAQGDDDPCWKGYEAVGLKRKGKRMVPNCVPVSR